jgi:thymidine phosphorylase
VGCSEAGSLVLGGGKLKLKRLGIDTYQEAVVYMNRDCHVCRAEGFSAQSRVRVDYGKRYVIATLNVLSGGLLADGEASLSESAWRALHAEEAASSGAVACD